MKKIYTTFMILLLLLSFISCSDEVHPLNKQIITEFEVRENELYMNNLINTKTYNQFVEILKQNPQIDTLVQVNMPGSVDDDTMIKLAYYVREKGLNTKLLSYSMIDSGGVDLFLAGVERTMQRGAHIGVHSWSDGSKDGSEYPKSSGEHELNRKYIEDMLGSDEFYWYTIYAAPADGIKQMSVEDIEKFGLLTEDIIHVDYKASGKVPGNIQYIADAIGDLDNDTVIINAQGGPMTYFDYDTFANLYFEIAQVDFNVSLLVNVNQAQTIEPWQFDKESISFEKAKEYDIQSTEYLAQTIEYFKEIGKDVYVVGISYGAFLVQDLITRHGNIADKYFIMAGRLDMNEEVWQEFSKGNYVMFENGVDVLEASPDSELTVEDNNMAKLAAGLGYKRYTELLSDSDLSNVLYVYSTKDEQVGSLSAEEVTFLESKGAQVITTDKEHSKTIAANMKVGVDYLLGR